ncbi:MAG: glycoside hydrolase family 26 protein [Trueperaceae bacterium]
MISRLNISLLGRSRRSLVLWLSLVLMTACANSPASSPLGHNPVKETPPTETSHQESDTPLVEPQLPSPKPQTPTTLPNKPLFGSYTYGGVWGGMEPVYTLEGQLGQKLSIVHWYMSFDHTWDAHLFEIASEGGRLPMIAWQPHRQPLDDIINGVHDAYIKSWAVGAKDFGGPIYIRPFPEMNGNWTPWHGNPAKLVLAWKHVVDIFRAEGASNVKWVWSPNITDEPRVDDNKFEMYYPGTDYVDILALDGYNWGTVRSYTAWKSYEEIFAQPYERVSLLGPQPIWLAEVASTEHGGNKAQWIADMFASTKFPRIEAIVWFDEDKETDWRIASSSGSLSAFQNGLSTLLQVASE